MNTLPNNFTSQKVYQYKGTNLQSIKLPNIRKPYTALNLGLAGVSDAKLLPILDRSSFVSDNVCDNPAVST